MLGALTDFVSSPRGKWVTLVVWVLAAGALLSQLPRLDEVRENEEALFLPGDAESTLAFELARDEFPARGTPTLIVFREPAGLSDTTLAAVDDLVAWLTAPDAPDNITDVRAPGAIPGLVSPDRTTLYIFVELSGEPAEEPFADTINAIRDRTAALDLPGVEVAVGGPGGLVVDIVGGVPADRHVPVPCHRRAGDGAADRHLPIAPRGGDPAARRRAGLPARGGHRRVHRARVRAADLRPGNRHHDRRAVRHRDGLRALRLRPLPRGAHPPRRPP